MKRQLSFRQVAVSLLAAGTLSGCAGQAPATAPEPLTAPLATQGEGPALKVLTNSEEYGKRLTALIERLDLSDAQQKEVKGVIEQAFESARPMLSLLKALVADPAAEQETLAAGLKAVMQLDAVQDAQTLEALRGVLTVEQRQEMAEAFPELLASQDGELTELIQELTAGLAEKLELNASQREKLARAMADFQSFWQKHEEAYVSAMAEHMTQGGQLELQQTFEALSRTYDPDSMAAFLASLDRSQRQTLNETIASMKNWILDQL